MAHYPDYPRIAQTLLDQQKQVNDLTAERDAAYRERAQLLAWLATFVPAAITDAHDVDEPGWRLLFLRPSVTQLSWHIHPRDAELFENVWHVGNADWRVQWDGHSTKEKYERIRLLVDHNEGPDAVAPSTVDEGSAPS